ncbi:hypothetical protein AC249_AIPGENE7309 [Exaiptasia diaphana]|nr:hypothetical protein AC249_AIPGENE7309 [Exaiptasia diaphana]
MFFPSTGMFVGVSQGGIHQPVDGFTKHIKTLVHNLLKSITPDTPIYRGNWSISGDLDGPLDLYNTVSRDCLNAAKGGVRSYEGEKTGHVLTLRCEYQTLRKLEKSKAIIFSIRTYQMRLEDFKNFPREDTEMLIEAIENIHPDFIEYKGVDHWKEAALQYLKRDVLGEEEAFQFPWIKNPWKTALVLAFCASTLSVVVSLLKR